MTPVEIIEQAIVEGVILALFTADTITATGAQSVVDRWLPTIRVNKTSILCELQRERRRTKILVMLEAAPSTCYVVIADNPNTDPVIIAVGIRNVATFELEIPHAYYDPFTLLELIQQYAGDEYANT